MVVDHPTAVAVAVEAQRQVGLVHVHRLGHGQQHLVVFGIGVVAGEGVVEFAVGLDHHWHAHPADGLRREGPGRAIAAGDHHLQRPRDAGAGGGVGDVAFLHAPYVGQAAARPRLALAGEHDFLEPAHLVGAEGQRRPGPHLHPAPAVLVMAGGDHGHAGGVQVELGEIGDRRHRQADVEDLAARLDQPQGQGLLDGKRIGPVVMSDHHPALAEILEQGPEPQAHDLRAQQVELRPEQPAGVVLTKAGRLHQGLVLELQRVGDKVGARGVEHRFLRKQGSLRPG